MTPAINRPTFSNPAGPIRGQLVDGSPQKLVGNEDGTLRAVPLGRSRVRSNQWQQDCGISLTSLSHDWR